MKEIAVTPEMVRKAKNVLYRWGALEFESWAGDDLLVKDMLVAALSDCLSNVPRMVATGHLVFDYLSGERIMSGHLEFTPEGIQPLHPAPSQKSEEPCEQLAQEVYLARVLAESVSGAALTAKIPARDAQKVIANFLNLLPRGEQRWPWQPIAEQLAKKVAALGSGDL